MLEQREWRKPARSGKSAAYWEQQNFQETEDEAGAEGKKNPDSELTTSEDAPRSELAEIAEPAAAEQAEPSETANHSASEPHYCSELQHDETIAVVARSAYTPEAETAAFAKLE